MNKKLLTASVLIVLSYLVISCSSKKIEKADLIFHNGTIATLEDKMPMAEAIAIKGDTILAVGTNDEIESFKSDTTLVIDLKGKFVMPGFIESHAHFLGIGKSKMVLDLTEAHNWEEIVYLVASAAMRAAPGEWIIGRGWHQEKWDPEPNPNVEGYPIHNSLSAASPSNPVMLTHASGHAVFANAKAMQIAGIDNKTESPQGGKIVRDSLGDAIGVFEEEAELLIGRVYYEYKSGMNSEALLNEKLRAVELASEECLSKGITTLHDAGENFETIQMFKDLADRSKLGVRLYVMIYEDNQTIEDSVGKYKMVGYGDDHLTVRSIKKYIDGALGSRGAWLLNSYEDVPFNIVAGDTVDNVGLNTTPLSELRETARIAAENDLQMCTHAIGDKANREILNIYEKYVLKSGDKMRWRIEHAQHISDRDIPRFAKLNVIAAMQGVHCTSDAVFVKKRLGGYRAKENSYSWRKLIDAGAIICNGTDAPVEDVDPLRSFYSSITRKLDDGRAFYPEQAMTREEALRSYTINGAYAAFEENIKGSLKPGKLADIVVLSNNILESSADAILNTEVLYTIVGGKVLYQKGE